MGLAALAGCMDLEALPGSMGLVGSAGCMDLEALVGYTDLVDYMDHPLD